MVEGKTKSDEQSSLLNWKLRMCIETKYEHVFVSRTYLPPSHARTSGGSGNLLQTPLSDSNTYSQNNGFSNGFPQTGNGFSQSGNEYSQSGIEIPQSGSFAKNSEFNNVNGFNNFGVEARPERAQATLERNAAILRQDNSNDGETFSYAYETENGIYAEESGVVTNGVEAQGGYSYTGDDGQVYSIRYTADQNGFVPQGDHIPTPPPVPEEILKALEQNARDEAAGIYDDGSGNLLQTPLSDRNTYSQNNGFSNGFPQTGNGFSQIANEYSQSGIETPQPGSFAKNSEFNNVNGFNNFGVEARPERAQAALERNAAILRQDNSNDGETFSYAYETENGIYAEESGVATNGVEAQGGYSYTGDDGQVYSIRYTADQNGFVPQGDHIPTPPPVPEDILKALEQNARDEAAGIYDDAESDKNAELINYKNALTPEGYAYSFDTSNGIHKDESATTADGVKALGSYSYTGDDGKVYSVIYSADENGFQPRGDHFPTPPPIPEAIQMVIEQAKKDKEAGITHDGKNHISILVMISDRSYDEERYGHMKYQGPLNRYLKNKQRNYEMRNRKIVPGSKKMHKKTVAVMDAEGYNYQDNIDHGKNVQQSYVQSSVNNLNGQFGMKRVATVPMNERHANNKQNVEKKYFSLPLTPIEYQQDNNQPRIHKPSANEYTTNSQSPKMNKNRGKGVQGPSFKPKNNNNIIPFSNMATNSTYENNRQVKTKLDFNKNPSKMITPQDAGYLYVPPRNIFIEGRFQDKPTILNEAPNNDITYINVKTKATVPVSQLYYIDHFDKNNNKNYQLQERPISKITTYTTTEEPINQPTYRSDFYGSTNRDVDQSTEEERNASDKKPSKGSNPTITTTQPYGNTLSTNYNDKDYTDNIHQQEDTLNLDNRDENGFPSTSNDIENTSYQSTTPMPSHTKYTSQPLVDLNQYDTTYPPIGYDNTPPNAATNYPENEGYFRTSPDVPATFEDLPTSKYKAIYKVDGVQAELTPNIKVDGFGRPIQDTSNSNFPNGNRYSTTGILMNDKNTDDKLTPAALYPSNFEAQLPDKNANPEDDEMSYPDDVLELERASASDYGNKKITTDGVIGEDFSGPKQQQRYDSETGYFY
ncbi:putative cuticle protein [Operophtera brumata]|uniref:Putative cuticle protein n=1 Tax=Operophtera brumata TaxID=104452 RepID=A0A0L7KNI3_OPEBR|nr:putative cuticle protein [Operophtera brumata]